MKLFKINITLTVCTFILSIIFSVPTYAGGFSFSGHGHSVIFSSGGHRSHYNSRHNRHSYGRHYSSGSHYNYGHHNSYRKPCHEVSKTTVDEYGEYRKIGGTMCYDSYGQGYVVSGSRYYIR